MFSDVIIHGHNPIHPNNILGCFLGADGWIDNRHGTVYLGVQLRSSASLWCRGHKTLTHIQSSLSTLWYNIVCHRGACDGSSQSADQTY